MSRDMTDHTSSTVHVDAVPLLCSPIEYAQAYPRYMYILNLCYITGKTVWQNSFGSPVVAIYSIEGGALRKIPMTTIALGTMERLTGSSVLAIRTDTYGIKATDSVLQ